jgi:excisionase family DNA binding protein
MTSKQVTKAPRKQNQRRGNGVLLTTEELAKELGENPRTIRTWKHKHAIPYVHLGYRTHRFKLNDVLAHLERRTIKPVVAH